MAVLFTDRDRDSAMSMIASYSLALLIFSTSFFLRDRLKQRFIVNFLADVSYPLYLVHCVAGYALLRWFEIRQISPYLSLTCVVLIALASAYILHVFVELPSNRIGKKLGEAMDRLLENTKFPLSKSTRTT